MDTFKEYSEAVHGFAQYPWQGNNIVYPAMGLAGEAGEVCDKVKKHWRNEGGMADASLDPLDRRALLLEMGDVLWYLDALANELGVSLGVVAQMNADKLRSRADRGVIKGKGDDR